MNNYQLSIIIPARNEMFLKQTIDDILKNKEAKTEVIAVLDGVWANPPIPQHPDVNIIYVPEGIGQRAATNLGVKLSKSYWVCKLDAHCSFDKGFDRKMLEAFKIAGDNATIVPIMRNLWAFDWKCYKCGSRWYQGPTPTRCMRHIKKYTIIPNEKCDETKNIRRRITWSVEAKKGESAYYNWKGRFSPANSSYCFDATPHFQYFGEYTKRPEYKKMLKETGLTETMSLQGSCFMMMRKRYLELNICDESFGSWGNQGIEVACKSWLSGGKVLCNHKTWYAHLFRTQGGDFGFPYEHLAKEIEETKNKVKDMFFNNKWDKAIHPLSWLVKKFMPVKGWSDKDLKNLKIRN